MDTHPVLEKVHRFEGVTGTTDKYYCYRTAERESVSFNVRGVFFPWIQSSACLQMTLFSSFSEELQVDHSTQNAQLH